MILKPDTAYHCETIDDAREWIRLANEQGLNDGFPIKENSWNVHKENTFFIFQSKFNECIYSDYDYLRSKNMEIIKFKANQEEIKWGDEVEVSDDGEKWDESIRIYVGKNPINNYNVVVGKVSETCWDFKYIRKAPQTISIEEAEKILKEHGINKKIKS